jgi:hypothetical protein
VKWIEDWGNPSRCYQIGLLACTAPYVLPIADDGVFLNNGAIDNAFASLNSLSPSDKNIISLRYYEGRTTRKPANHTNCWMMKNNNPYDNLDHIPPHFFMIMAGLFPREYILELGGFDCAFEQAGFAAPDLGARAQHNGAAIVLGDFYLDINEAIYGERDLYLNIFGKVLPI